MRSIRLSLLALAAVAVLASRPLRAQDAASLAPPEGNTLKALASEVSAVGLSSNGRWLVTAAVVPDRAVRVFDTATWKVRLEVSGWPVVLSPDGTQLALCEHSAIAVYDIESGRKVTTCGRCNAGPFSLSPDHRYLAAGYNDSGNSDATTGWHAGVWDLTTGQEVQTVALGDGPAGTLGFSADSREVVVWQWRRRADVDPESKDGTWTPGSTGFLDQQLHAQDESIHHVVDVATGVSRRLASPRGSLEVRDRVRMSADGQHVAWSLGPLKKGEPGLLAMTDLQSGAVLWSVAADRGTASWGAGERELLHWADPGVTVRDPATGAVLGRCELPKDATSSRVALVGDHVVCGRKDGSLVFVPVPREGPAR